MGGYADRYTIRNVSRCWAYETAVLLDQPDVPNELPFNDYFEYPMPTILNRRPTSSVYHCRLFSLMSQRRCDALTWAVAHLQRLCSAPMISTVKRLSLCSFALRCVRCDGLAHC